MNNEVEHCDIHEGGGSKGRGQEKEEECVKPGALVH